ncbi:glycosyl hydrolase family 18 protein [Streptomyces sp. NPDC059063]|uniref:glycosyl hydrolase family 18 protein n=1 Tax=unclassified Streptomyces TaxID=2593676 RepID=UPI0036815193
MKRRTVLLGALALSVTTGATAAAAEPAAANRRVVVYYQTQYANGAYVSPLGLTDNNTGVTDVIVAAVHLNDINGPYKPVHLNDDPPGAAKFDPMWRDLKAMQGRGVHMLAMVGGAAPGSFTRLDTEFDTYYPLLRDFLRQYGFDGVDLDVEERMSLAGIERVIDALRRDFGAGFLITLAPVGSALSGGGNLSGLDYERLYRDRGGDIAWFNAQFYNGWGSMASTSSYDAVVRRGLIPASKVVAGTLTDPSNGGSGYVDVTRLKSTVRSLVAKYPQMGGVMGWEYFNSQPGGAAAPWRWAAEVKSALAG